MGKLKSRTNQKGRRASKTGTHKVKLITSPAAAVINSGSKRRVPFPTETSNVAARALGRARRESPMKTRDMSSRVGGGGVEEGG